MHESGKYPLTGRRYSCQIVTTRVSGNGLQKNWRLGKCYALKRVLLGWKGAKNLQKSVSVLGIDIEKQELCPKAMIEKRQSATAPGRNVTGIVDNCDIFPAKLAGNADLQHFCVRKYVDKPDSFVEECAIFVEQLWQDITKPVEIPGKKARFCVDYNISVLGNGSYWRQYSWIGLAEYHHRNTADIKCRQK